jgi:hypothetical protein
VSWQVGSRRFGEPREKSEIIEETRGKQRGTTLQIEQRERNWLRPFFEVGTNSGGHQSRERPVLTDATAVGGWVARKIGNHWKFPQKTVLAEQWGHNGSKSEMFSVGPRVPG